MKKYLTRKHIGYTLSLLLGIFLAMSSVPMMLGTKNATNMFEGTNLTNWVVIIGIGKTLSIILFLINKTQTIGLLLLTALFGGAIMYHMSHVDPERQNFIMAVIFLLLTWFVGWLRGCVRLK